MSRLRFHRAVLVGVLMFTVHVGCSIGVVSAQSASLSVPENASPGTIIGPLEPEFITPASRCSIVSGNDETAFSLDDRNRLRVNNSAALNHERRERFDLVLKVESPANDEPARRAFLADLIRSGASLTVIEEMLTDTRQLPVTVVVEDVPEPPVLPVQSATVMVSGREPAEEAWLAAEDEDHNESLNFEILAGAPVGLFGIERRTGRVWVAQPHELAPGDHRFPLTVQVTDSAGRSDATTITLRVIALAGKPELLTVAAPSISETDRVKSDALSSVEPAATPADIATHQTRTGIEPLVGPFAVNRPGRAQPEDAGRESPLANESASVNDASTSVTGKLLLGAGIFVLLGSVVLLVLAFLRWRSDRDDIDLAGQAERFRGLASTTGDSAAEQGEAGSMSALEDRVLGQLSDLRHILAASKTDTGAADNDCDRIDDAMDATASDAIDIPGVPDVRHSDDLLNLRSNESPGSFETEPEEVFEIAADQQEAIDPVKRQAPHTKDPEQVGVDVPESGDVTTTQVSRTFDESQHPLAEWEADGATGGHPAAPTPGTDPVDNDPAGDRGNSDAPPVQTAGEVLTTARHMTQRSEPAVESPERIETSQPDTPDTSAQERRPTTARLSKSAMRRELSSLRTVANQHARALIATEESRRQSRNTWYKSMGLMVILNLAAMGLLAAHPVGLLRLLPWVFMLAGAVALAVCLHSFRQMDDTADAAGLSDVEDEFGPSDATPDLAVQTALSFAGEPRPVPDGTAWRRSADSAATDRPQESAVGHGLARSTPR